MSKAFLFSGWVVAHRDSHDHTESAKRAITDYASNATDAWSHFLQLVGQKRSAKQTWVARGYIAHRVTIQVKMQ